MDILVGWCVQVDPMKPTLKAPGSKSLKPEDKKMPSNFAFNADLRRYILGVHIGLRGIPLALDMAVEDIAGMTQGFTVGTPA